METEILKQISDLKNTERMNRKILHHSLIYCQALDDLATLIFGEDNAKELLQEINIVHDKELKRKYWKGVLTATFVFIIFLLL